MQFDRRGGYHCAALFFIYAILSTSAKYGRAGSVDMWQTWGDKKLANPLKPFLYAMQDNGMQFVVVVL